VGDARRAEGARTLGVHAPLGDNLAGEVGELLDKPKILQEQRAAGTGTHAVLIIRDGRTRRSGQRLVFSSNAIFFSLVVGSGIFTPLAAVWDVRTKETGVYWLQPYWTDSSLASARLPPQAAKRHVFHRFGHLRRAGRTARLRGSVCE
jgi:hypothetical protein